MGAVTMERQIMGSVQPEKLKEYKGFIWTQDLIQPRQRVTVMAADPEEALMLLEEKHGQGSVHDLHNEEEANTIR